MDLSTSERAPESDMAEKGNLFWFLSGILTCIYCQVPALNICLLVMTYSCTVCIVYFVFVYGTLKLYCCCSEGHKHTGYCYYASEVLKISLPASLMTADLLVNLVKTIQIWEWRVKVHVNSSCLQVQSVLMEGKTAGRLVWSKLFLFEINRTTFTAVPTLQPWHALRIGGLCKARHASLWASKSKTIYGLSL